MYSKRSCRSAELGYSIHKGRDKTLKLVFEVFLMVFGDANIME